VKAAPVTNVDLGAVKMANVDEGVQAILAVKIMARAALFRQHLMAHRLSA
jgi:hypothetical protein